MSQKYYKFKIVESLLRKENHIRALARELKTNQTTIARKINELRRENVTDYKQEGRNKVYFLKRSLEAFQFIVITEHIRLLDIIKEYTYLRRAIEEIKLNKKIKLAILFGSHARRSAVKGSDIDIFIETNDKNIKKEVENINSAISVKIGRFDRKSLLIKEVMKAHIIIKGVETFYEKLGFLEKN